MKTSYRYLFVSAVICCMMSIPARAQQNNYLLEAEDFQFKGGWVVEQEDSKPLSGNKMLRVMAVKAPVVDALTVMAIKQAGSYSVWVRSADYPADRPGTRLFRLYVNEQAMEQESGKHGKDGFYWEKAGQLTLPAGNVIVRLKDTRGNFGRCDAILLSATEDFDPNTQTLAALAGYKVKPVTQQATAVKYPALPEVRTAADGPATAAIANEHLRLRFVPVVMPGSGEKRLAAKTEVKQKGRWISMNAQQEDHKVFVIHADNPQPGFGNYFPSWNGSTGLTSFANNGKEYTILETDNALNPFLAGVLTEAIPVAAKQVNNNTIEVTYTVSGEQLIKGIWTLAPRARHLNVSLQFKPTQSSYYSIGVAAFQSMAADSVTNIQLPPMFQYRRLSPQPVLLLSAMMPQPLAIAETKMGEGLFTTFASGNAGSFPLAWGDAWNSPMGFSIKNEVNRVQPVAFAPVLGFNDSKLTAGQILQRDFVIGAVAGNWNEALEYISDSIYKVRDYRTQGKASLSDAAFNMIDLIKNDSAAGWDTQLKGFYDIEANPVKAPTVVQSAPLGVISAAVLSRDEDFYITRALPTIEYTLSRSGFRWAKAISGTPFNSDKKSLQFSPFGSQFTTNYFEGLYHLLGEANPWLTDIALPNGAIRQARGYSVDVPAWTQELAAWRLTKEEKWLTAAKADADKYIAAQVNGNLTKPLSRLPFYNAAFYAYWWDLMDLYEITKEERFLQAATTSAFQTVAGIRSYPLVKDSLQTIHPGDQFEGNTTLWWKNNKKYRLGFPRVKGDAPEKQVPQALVSPVGLGFEQPFTYFDAGHTVRPVFMSSWAPHLLRLFQYTHRQIFDTYARNAVIGRFTNYPGYYATGFTDITMQPDFPYKGPDVSSIYYHHIPPHLAFTLDYLITEAIQRSNGKVQFPYGKQDGFVWFTNRVFGGGKGKVFGEEASLWMKKGLVKVDKPEVNYVTAISGDRFWILLLNEAHNTIQANITLGSEVPVTGTATANLYSGAAAKQATAKMNNKTISVSLTPQGFTALSVPLTSKQVTQKETPVTNGMKVIDMGAPWGKCYVFRIRSPFGWDSIYGYLESAPLEGAAVSATFNTQTVTKNTYPYEWSFCKMKAGQPVKGVVQLKTADGKTKEVSIEFE